MLKYAFSIMLAFLVTFQVQAQSIAIIDITAVLEEMDDYKAAQQELDRIAADWRQKIAQEHDKIKSLYNKYQAEQVLLSDDMKVSREEEIMKKEKDVRDLQRQKFGPDGELFARRQQLINPIQDKVYAAIESYAGDKSIDIIFDKSSSTGLIFANDKYDKTDEVKRRLGL